MKRVGLKIAAIITSTRVSVDRVTGSNHINTRCQSCRTIALDGNVSRVRYYLNIGKYQNQTWLCPRCTEVALELRDSIMNKKAV